MTNTLETLAESVDDFNRRFTSIIENDRLDTESKNLAIGMLVTLRAPTFRQVAAALRARAQKKDEPDADS